MSFFEFPVFYGLIFCTTGFFAGITAGLLGVGGGLIVVPVLFYFDPLGSDLAIRMHIAIGTSLAVMMVTATSSTVTHLKYKAVDLGVLRVWGPGIIFGAIFGVIFARLSSQGVLVGLFGTLTLVIATIMAYTSEGFRVNIKVLQNFRFSLTLLIGFISSVLGIGGGTFTVPLLSMRGLPIQRAIATSAVVGLMIAIPGTIGFMLSGLNISGRPAWSIGFVNLIGVLLISIVSLMTAPLGAMLTHTLNPTWLRKIFAIFLAVIGIRMLVTSFSFL